MADEKKPVPVPKDSIPPPPPPPAYPWLSGPNDTSYGQPGELAFGIQRVTIPQRW